MKDMNKSRSFITTSKQELQEIFELFDFNNNGSISLDDFQKIMSSQGFFPTKSEIKSMLNHKVADDNPHASSQDADSKDVINFETFVQIANDKINQKHIYELDAKTAFSVLDKDSDGLISRGDLKKTLQAYLRHPTEQEVDKLMEEAGVERDEDIDFNHFVLALGLED